MRTCYEDPRYPGHCLDLLVAVLSGLDAFYWSMVLRESGYLSHVPALRIGRVEGIDVKRHDYSLVVKMSMPCPSGGALRWDINGEGWSLGPEAKRPRKGDLKSETFSRSTLYHYEFRL